MGVGEGWPRRGRGGGGSGRAEQQRDGWKHKRGSGRSSVLGSGRADGTPPNPIALRAGAVPGHLPRESCSPALAQERRERRSQIRAGAVPAFPARGPFRAQAVAPPLPRRLQPGSGLGEWSVRRAPRSLRTVWSSAILGVAGGCPCSAQRCRGSAGRSSGRMRTVHRRNRASEIGEEEG
ncbi:uncharacterized protein LOC143441643 [Arvicanthis niloticus]|uniref:uncharacterized protein LOC143311784 n=1 Tax=Arvicanthis niloticus TaxID=61156 RepID=UPI00402BF29B